MQENWQISTSNSEQEINNIKKLFQNQKDSLNNSPLKDYKNRIKLLKSLKQNILEMQDEILEALKLDLNKSKEESYMCEVGLALSEITYMLKHLKKFSKIQKVKTSLSQFPAKSYKIPCAYGSVLIISPWNYPFLLAFQPLIDAISAGNSVVIKPSEISFHTQFVVKKLIEKTFKPEQVFVALGDKEICSAMLDLDFDYIFYTGSANVGKIVLNKAAKHLTPVTLELGGKSPCIVDKTAKIELSAKRIIFGKLLNAGQTCVAPDFIYCDENIKDKLIDELKKQIKIQYSNEPINNKNYPKIINKNHFDRLLTLINESQSNNNIIAGGNVDFESLKIEPTLINSDFNDILIQEEIFGPVLPIVTYKTTNELITNLNKLEKPLALYVFSESKSNQQKIINSTNFGGGCINDTVVHLSSPNLPFGGVKQSGMGAYHGKTGFDTFTHYKSIMNKKTWLDLPIRYQKPSKLKSFLVRMFLK